MKKIILVGIACFSLFSCKKADQAIVEPVETPRVNVQSVNSRISTTNIDIGISDHNHNLNIVYFVPEDLGYLKMLSKTLKRINDLGVRLL